MSKIGDRTAPVSGQIQGRHVLAMFIGFFGIVFVVNGYFLVSALRTHSGVVAVEPYRKGLAYNDRVAAAERQAGLGWQETVAVTGDGKLSVSISSREGAPVTGLIVTALIWRPTVATHDRPLVLQEDTPGRYVGAAGALPEGNWIVAVEARTAKTGMEPTFRARRRLWVKS